MTNITNELTSFILGQVKNKASKSGQQLYVANSWVSHDEDYMARVAHVARACSRARTDQDRWAEQDATFMGKEGTATSNALMTLDWFF